MGRPSKLSPEIQERICSALRGGNYESAAAASAGVGSSTVRQWLQWGRDAKSARYVAFLTAVTRAREDAELRLVELWQEAMPNDWRAIAEFLARRYPERWGKRERAEVTVSATADAVPQRLSKKLLDQIKHEIYGL